MSLSLTLTSCAHSVPPSRYSLYVSPEFGPKRELVISAAEEWSARTGVVMVPYGSPRGGKNREGWVDAISVVPAGHTEDICGGPGFTGCTSTDGSAWLCQIKVDLSDADTYSVALHELGHAMRLQHVPNPKAVMYHSTSARHLTQDDIEQYLDLRVR